MIEGAIEFLSLKKLNKKIEKDRRKKQLRKEIMQANL
jgi:hypothetical protein